MRVTILFLCASLLACNNDERCLGLVGATVDQADLDSDETCPAHFPDGCKASGGQFTPITYAGPVCDLECCAVPGCFTRCGVDCSATEGVSYWRRYIPICGKDPANAHIGGRCYVMVKDGKVLGASWRGTDAPIACD